MSKGKLGLAVVLTVLAAAAGLYLSGYVTMALLKVHAPLHWNTYVEYIQALGDARYRPYAGKIKAAGWIGFGAVLIVYVLILALLFKGKRQSLHGDARFANAGDLNKHKMLQPSNTGIIVGKFGGKLVRLPGQQFVILAAPTRSGKGVGIVIPNLLDYAESVVVLTS